MREKKHRWALGWEPKHLFGEAKADWLGNNAAFACPICQHIYIVSNGIEDHSAKQFVRGKRFCANCGKSKAFVTGGRDNKGEAWIEWPVEKEAE